MESGEAAVSQPEYSVDPINALEQGVAFALGEVPVVGSLLSTLVYILWPSGSSDDQVWNSIESKVSEVVNVAISKEVQDQVNADLAGLYNDINEYMFLLKFDPDNKNAISQSWLTTHEFFIDKLPTFQMTDYQLQLLSLFAQFGNLHLGLLRDGAAFGADWGWSDNEVQLCANALTETIANYNNYVLGVYHHHQNEIISNTSVDPEKNEPFTSTNRFVRQITPSVLDFSNLWQYYDITKYPNGHAPVLDRELYSDPQGTSHAAPISLPTFPTTPILSIDLWTGDRIDSVQVTYAEGGGPNGATTTPRMGNPGSGNPPNGHIVIDPSNPVIRAYGRSGDVVEAIGFDFLDGTSSGEFGDHPSNPDGPYQGKSFVWEFNGNQLSSIYVNGESKFYKTSECIIFGFKLSNSYPDAENLAINYYITSPVESTDRKFAPYKRARDDYWESIRKNAKSG